MLTLSLDFPSNWAAGIFGISSHVFDVFARNAQQQFIDELVNLLRKQVPSFAATDPAVLHRDIPPLIANANGFGLRSRAGVACFVLTAAHLGPDFPARFPAARQILDSTARENVKVERLEDFTIELFEALQAEMGWGDTFSR